MNIIEIHKPGICIYCSINKMLHETLYSNINEYELFIISGGFKFQYTKSNWQQPIYTNFSFYDYRDVFNELVLKLNIHYSHISTESLFENDLSDVFKQGKTILCITDVQSLGYDRSYLHRGDAVHCVRIKNINRKEIFFIDDYVPSADGNIYTKEGIMDYDRCRNYIHGFAYFLNVDRFTDLNKVFMYELGNCFKYYLKSDNPLILFFNDFKNLYTTELNEQFYLELVVILQYCIYPAIKYLFQAIFAIPFFLSCKQDLESIIKLWPAIYELNKLYFITKNKLYLDKLIKMLNELISELILTVKKCNNIMEKKYDHI